MLLRGEMYELPDVMRLWGNSNLRSMRALDAGCSGRWLVGGREVRPWVAVGRYMVDCIADMYIVATSDGRTTL